MANLPWGVVFQMMFLGKKEWLVVGGDVVLVFFTKVLKAADFYVGCQKLPASRAVFFSWELFSWKRRLLSTKPHLSIAVALL
jgi:hypothetical protein